MICVARVGALSEVARLAFLARVIAIAMHNTILRTWKTYAPRVFIALLKVQVRANALFFYSYFGHQRKSSEAEIRFVYEIFGIGGDWRECDFALARACNTAFCATDEFFRFLS